MPWCLNKIYQLDDETGGADPLKIKCGPEEVPGALGLRLSSENLVADFFRELGKPVSHPAYKFTLHLCQM